jgi:hypothetical protein
LTLIVVYEISRAHFYFARRLRESAGLQSARGADAAGAAENLLAESDFAEAGGQRAVSGSSAGHHTAALAEQQWRDVPLVSWTYSRRAVDGDGLHGFSRQLDRCGGRAVATVLQNGREPIAMKGKLVSDVMQAIAPTGISFAVVNLTEVKDLVAIVSLGIGTVCTVLITRRKLKNHRRK